MVTRQLPKPAELLELMQFKKPELDGRKRRLAAALTIADLRTIAKRRTPKAAFDYTDGAAEGELSLSRARQAFEDIEFHPGILRPAEHVDLSTTILGGPSALPFGIAPTGFTRLMQTEGETAGASAAGAAGIPFTLSTLGTTSIEGVKAALLRECLPTDIFNDPARLAAGIKALPLRLKSARPIAEAISSAGGIAFEALDESFMLRALPGVFCAGEMLDWEAPTGGYLLTACFATGRAAGIHAAHWLMAR